jgi:hypothetical protein
MTVFDFLLGGLGGEFGFVDRREPKDLMLFEECRVKKEHLGYWVEVV